MGGTGEETMTDLVKGDGADGASAGTIPDALTTNPAMQEDKAVGEIAKAENAKAENPPTSVGGSTKVEYLRLADVKSLEHLGRLAPVNELDEAAVLQELDVIGEPMDAPRAWAAKTIEMKQKERERVLEFDTRMCARDTEQRARENRASALLERRRFLQKRLEKVRAEKAGK